MRHRTLSRLNRTVAIFPPLWQIASEKDNFFIVADRDVSQRDGTHRHQMHQAPKMKHSPLAATANPLEVAAVLTGSQIRAARALLKWSGQDLAKHSGVSYPAIQRAERTNEMPNMHTRNLAAIKTALEAGGVIFLDAGASRDGGPGVRLK